MSMYTLLGKRSAGNAEKPPIADPSIKPIKFTMQNIPNDLLHL